MPWIKKRGEAFVKRHLILNPVLKRDTCTGPVPIVLRHCQDKADGDFIDLRLLNT